MLPRLRIIWSQATTSLSQCLLQQPGLPLNRIDSKGLSSLSQCLKTFEPLSHNPTSNQASERLLQQEHLAMHQSVRTKVRVYYKGSAWKRYNKHNIEKRLTTPGGLEMLWRKTLKGRLNLAAYERILPNTVDSKIVPDHQFKYKAHPLTKRRLPKPGLF